MVVFIPAPVSVAPGFLDKVHIPVAGNPDNETVPVGVSQVGWIIFPTIGADGVSGAALIVIFAVGDEVQPTAFETVKLKVPDARPVTVLLVPVPLMVIPPGFLVNVQAPVPGNPDIMTLPVAVEQVGWVKVPIIGIAGTTGAALIAKFAEDKHVGLMELRMLIE